jgi:hypothetical protein
MHISQQPNTLQPLIVLIVHHETYGSALPHQHAFSEADTYFFVLLLSSILSVVKHTSPIHQLTEVTGLEGTGNIVQLSIQLGQLPDITYVLAISVLIAISHLLAVHHASISASLSNTHTSTIS